MATRADGRRWRRNRRRKFRQFDAFDVEKTNLDLHREKQLHVGDGLAADHVTSKQGVDGVAPVFERPQLRREDVERRTVGDDGHGQLRMIGTAAISACVATDGQLSRQVRPNLEVLDVSDGDFVRQAFDGGRQAVAVAAVAEVNGLVVGAELDEDMPASALAPQLGELGAFDGEVESLPLHQVDHVWLQDLLELLNRLALLLALRLGSHLPAIANLQFVNVLIREFQMCFMETCFN